MASRRAPPILYSSHLNEDIRGDHATPRGGATSFLFLGDTWQDARDYSCEAGNSVSKRETSGTETLVDGRSCPPAGL